MRALDYRAAREAAPEENWIQPYLVLDGGMDCEKTGVPTKQVERRGAPNPVPWIPLRFEHKLS
jgi:hypothetical protein